MNTGPEPDYVFSNGGLDANWLDKHGIPTVTIGAGQYEIQRSRSTWISPEYEKGCRLAILLATLDDGGRPDRRRRQQPRTRPRHCGNAVRPRLCFYGPADERQGPTKLIR